MSRETLPTTGEQLCVGLRAVYDCLHDRPTESRVQALPQVAGPRWTDRQGQAEGSGGGWTMTVALVTCVCVDCWSGWACTWCDDADEVDDG